MQPLMIISFSCNEINKVLFGNAWTDMHKDSKSDISENFAGERFNNFYFGSSSGS